MWYTWPGLVGRQLGDLAEPELGVARGRLAARRVPARQVRQEDPQHRGLHRVEARVVADQLEVLLGPRAVEAEHPDPVAELGVVHGDEPAVAEREQVLGREEAEGRGDARRDTRGAEGLRRVLDDRQAEPAELLDRRGRPKRCTGMIAFVRAVIRRSTSSGSRFSVTGSMSAKTGVAPTRAIASAVA